MTYRNLLPLFILLLLGVPLFGQLEDYPSSPENAVIFGGHASTRGLGATIDYVRGSGPTKLVFGLDFFEIKDSRESRIKSLYQDQGRKFVFDKLHFLYVVSPSFGISKNFFKSGSHNRINFSGSLSGGPAIGLLRPYMLEIAVPLPNSPGFAYIEEHQYDPEKYSFVDIIGQAPPFTGNFVQEVVLGFSVRMNSQINFAPQKNFVRGIRLGVKADIFPKKVPIMAESPNHNVYIAGIAGLVFGSRW